MTEYYRAFGFDFASDLVLPGVQLAEPGGDALVRVRLAGDDEGQHVHPDGGYQVQPGQVVMSIPNVATYVVRDGLDVAIQPAPGASDAHLRLFLMGSAFGALLHQRGLFPLHASAVLVGDCAVAFTGDSGAGKSTTAALLQQRGFPVLSDDVCALEITPGQDPLLWPGFARMKLWADSHQALDIPIDCDAQVHLQYDKYEVQLGTVDHQRPVELKRLYVLDTVDDGAAACVEEVRNKAEMLEMLLVNTYRFCLLDHSSQKQAHFQMCAELLKVLDVRRFRRPMAFEAVDQVMDVLVADWG